MELQRMFVTLALRADEFQRGLGDAADRAEGFRGRIDGVFSKLKLAAAGAMAAITAAVVAGFAMAVKNSTEVNAQLETTTLQFETLMGSADEASAHVANLFDFAERTPFETGPISDASLKLETFGGAALNTMENIELLGDAAAATNAPIDELGFWVGRLYANLQAGQPFGEAAMRLQELAVMSPQARQQMEALQKSGASAGEVFAVLQGDLERFTGAMEKQAGTWEGLVATASDQISLLLADALAPVFETAKEGLTEIIALLNDPDIQKGIMAMGKGLSDVVEVIAEASQGLLQMTAGLGQHGENQDMMAALGFNAVQFQNFMDSIRAEEGLGMGALIPGTAEYLQLTMAVNEALHERYAAELMLVDGIRARSEWDDFASQKLASLTEEMNRQAESADRVMLSYQSTARDSEWLARAADMVWSAQNKARLETNAYVAELEAEREALALAAAEAEAFAEAFAGVVETYSRTLPGSDNPLVQEGGLVSMITGGLGAEGAALLQTYQDKIAGLESTVSNLSAGVGTYGQTQDEVNKKIADAQGEIAHYQELLAPLAAQTGTVTTSQRDLAVNVNGVKQAIFDQLVQMNAAPEYIIAYGTAIGVMTKEQAYAALVAASVQKKIEELAAAIADGVPVEQAMADLDTFVNQITDGVIPGFEQGRDDVLRTMDEMVDGVSEKALAAGEGMMQGLNLGITDNQQVAIDAANSAAEETINAMNAKFEIESPAGSTMKMGGSLMEGLQQGVEDAVGAVISAVETVGGDVIAGLVRGIENAKSAVESAIQSIAGAIPDWLNQFLGIRSPARATIPPGEAIPEGVVKGIDNKTPLLRSALEDISDLVLDWSDDLSDAIDSAPDLGDVLDNPFDDNIGRAREMLGKLDELNKVASGFARNFQTRVLSPLGDRLDETNGRAEELESQFRSLVESLGLDPNTSVSRLYEDLNRIAHGNMFGGGYDFADQQAAAGALAAWEELRNVQWARNQLEDEYIRQQERLVELQKVQSDMDFLNRQLELLDLIANYADILPADFMDRFIVPLGLDADPGVLMAAMVGVMEEIVEAASAELSGGRLTPMPDTDLDGSTITIQNQNITGGQHNYFYDMDVSELEELGILSR